MFRRVIEEIMRDGIKPPKPPEPAPSLGTAFEFDSFMSKERMKAKSPEPPPPIVDVTARSDSGSVRSVVSNIINKNREHLNEELDTHFQVAIEHNDLDL